MMNLTFVILIYSYLFEAEYQTCSNQLRGIFCISLDTSLLSLNPAYFICGEEASPVLLNAKHLKEQLVPFLCSFWYVITSCTTIRCSNQLIHEEDNYVLVNFFGHTFIFKLSRLVMMVHLTF